MNFPSPPVVLKNFFGGYPLTLWNYLFSLVAALMASSPPVAKVVATNLPAILSVNATTGAITFAVGALGNQDGIPMLAGDEIMVPPGTIGAAVITPAESGPYLVTSLGSGSASPVVSRPSWWAQGTTIPSEARISVGGLGSTFPNTTWKTGPIAGGLVGTGDPLFAPDRVILAGVLLVGGTVRLTSVPIRTPSLGNPRVSVTAYATTVTAAGGTVGYGCIAAPIPGGVGTAAIVVDALAAGQTLNGGDGSTLTVTIEQ